MDADGLLGHHQPVSCAAVALPVARTKKERVGGGGREDGGPKGGGRRDRGATSTTHVKEALAVVGAKIFEPFPSKDKSDGCRRGAGWAGRAWRGKRRGVTEGESCARAT